MSFTLLQSILDSALELPLLSGLSDSLQKFSGETRGDFPVIGEVPGNVVHEMIKDINARGMFSSETDFGTENVTHILGSITDSLTPQDIDYTPPREGMFSKDELSSLIDSALDREGIEQEDARNQWRQLLTLISENESKSTPSAVNTWDANYTGEIVSDGHKYSASRGMFQLIPDTFSQYHEPGTSNNIYDPIAQVSATINYLQERYNIDLNGDNIQEFYSQRYPRYKGY